MIKTLSLSLSHWLLVSIDIIPGGAPWGRRWKSLKKGE
jgi:hypothetical protein